PGRARPGHPSGLHRAHRALPDRRRASEDGRLMLTPTPRFDSSGWAQPEYEAAHDPRPGEPGPLVVPDEQVQDRLWRLARVMQVTGAAHALERYRWARACRREWDA